MMGFHSSVLDATHGWLQPISANIRPLHHRDVHQNTGQASLVQRRRSANAVRHLGVGHIDTLPAPNQVWTAIHSAAQT